jgi:hypothetical protein
MSSYKKKYIINLMIKIKQKFQWLILTLGLLVINSSAHQFSLHKPQDKTPMEYLENLRGQHLYSYINYHKNILSSTNKLANTTSSSQNKLTKKNPLSHKKTVTLRQLFFDKDSSLYYKELEVKRLLIDKINRWLTFSIVFNYCKTTLKKNNSIESQNKLIDMFKKNHPIQRKSFEFYH